MTTSYFQPKGRMSVRAALVEIALSVEPGSLMTYDMLIDGVERLTGRRVVRAVLQQAANSAKKTLLVDHGTTLISQYNDGYRVAKPGEYADVASYHKKRGERQLTMAFDVVTHADTTKMTQAEYDRFHAMKVIVTNLHGRVHQAEDRLSRLESAVFGTSEIEQPHSSQRAAPRELSSSDERDEQRHDDRDDHTRQDVRERIFSRETSFGRAV